MKVFSPEELARQDRARTLVAVNGNVYDVSSSKRWAGGKHMNRHDAGSDLTDAINAAPHGPEVLERFEVVGTYEEKPVEPTVGIKGKVEAWLDTNPFFRRHPHPAVVHFPVALLPAALCFAVAARVTGSARTEWAAFCCLIAVLLVLPAAIATGYFTWWMNYAKAESPTIRAKRRLAWVLLVAVSLEVLLRGVFVRDALRLEDPYVIVYLVGLIVLAALGSVIGYLGGTLTFPYERHLS
ncbi:MAG: cytochrome b5 [Desulfomonile tiedjei]|nr:cytochrome b5 [Desulfomonile tiedjei]